MQLLEDCRPVGWVGRIHSTLAQQRQLLPSARSCVVLARTRLWPLTCPSCVMLMHRLAACRRSCGRSIRSWRTRWRSCWRRGSARRWVMTIPVVNRDRAVINKSLIQFLTERSVRALFLCLDLSSFRLSLTQMNAGDNAFTSPSPSKFPICSSLRRTPATARPPTRWPMGRAPRRWCRALPLATQQRTPKEVSFRVGQLGNWSAHEWLLQSLQQC